MSRCQGCEDLIGENNGLADELAFYMYQAEWWRASYSMLVAGLNEKVPGEADLDRARDDIEELRGPQGMADTQVPRVARP